MLTLKHTFSVSALYRQEQESLKGFLRKRWSFWLALFSCIAFLVGNMVGQHGFKAFWKSVWGKEQIAFEGTVYPLANIPDPERWAGRDRFDFSDVPSELLIPLPSYSPLSKCHRESRKDRSIYSVGYLGDYEYGGDQCGSHPGIDMLTAPGTPVVSIANGFVERVEERSWGYGNTVVIEHPNVPDVNDPKKTTTLYSSYAHLGHILVAEGDVVRKGDQIAVSGQTGFATAPHLHFQIDRKDAQDGEETPFHPYWPFTTSQATDAGYSFVEAVNQGLGQENARKFTVNPLVYVQEYLQGVVPVTTVADTGAPSVEASPLTWKERMQARRSTRRETRLAERPLKVVTQVTPIAGPENVVLPVVPTGPEPAMRTTSMSVLHDGTFEERTPEQIVLFARDAAGTFMQKVEFPGSISLETVFGDAEFAPATLTAASFDDRGRAFVELLPRGKKTIVPALRGAFTVDAEPMVLKPMNASTTLAPESSQGG